MTTDHIGGELRKAREHRGVPLREIAQRTKISVTALEAVERLDFSRLPGGIFGRAFVRAYAVEVGLDPDATVEAFVAEKVRYERERASARARPEVTKDDREFLERQQRAMRALRTTAMVVGAVLLVGAVIAAVWWWSSMHAPAIETPAARTAADVLLPVEGSVPPPPATLGPAPAPEGVVIELDATGDCWVQATADGLIVLSRLMRAGEHERLQAERELILDAGSAGELRWNLNGKPAKPLGRPGVHRQVRITRENLTEFLQ
jgi:cytoskeleton protein RodZ